MAGAIRRLAVLTALGALARASAEAGPEAAAAAPQRDGKTSEAALLKVLEGGGVYAGGASPAEEAAGESAQGSAVPAWAFEAVRSGEKAAAEAAAQHHEEVTAPPPSAHAEDAAASSRPAHREAAAAPASAHRAEAAAPSGSAHLEEEAGAHPSTAHHEKAAKAAPPPSEHREEAAAPPLSAHRGRTPPAPAHHEEGAARPPVVQHAQAATIGGVPMAPSGEVAKRVERQKEATPPPTAAHAEAAASPPTAHHEEAAAPSQSAHHAEVPSRSAHHKEAAAPHPSAHHAEAAVPPLPAHHEQAAPPPPTAHHAEASTPPASAHQAEAHHEEAAASSRQAHREEAATPPPAVHHEATPLPSAQHAEVATASASPTARSQEEQREAREAAQAAKLAEAEEEQSKAAKLAEAEEEQSKALQRAQAEAMTRSKRRAEEQRKARSAAASAKRAEEAKRRADKQRQARLAAAAAEEAAEDRPGHKESAAEKARGEEAKRASEADGAAPHPPVHGAAEATVVVSDAPRSSWVPPAPPLDSDGFPAIAKAPRSADGIPIALPPAGSLRRPSTPAAPRPSAAAPTSKAAAVLAFLSSRSSGYSRTFGDALRDGPSQFVICPAVTLAGAACLWDGRRSWRPLVSSFWVFGAAGVSFYEAHVAGLGLDQVFLVVALCFAFLAVALKCEAGFAVCEVCNAALLGALVAASCSWPTELLARLGADELVLALYAAGALAGALAHTAWSRPLITSLAPLLGGFLLVSGLGTALSHVAASVLPLPESGAPWTAAAAALVGPGAAWGQAACVACTAGLRRRRGLAVACLLTWVAVTALSALGVAHEGWKWTAFGCLTWAAVTGPSAWCQLGQLRQEETFEPASSGTPRFGGTQNTLLGSRATSGYGGATYDRHSYHQVEPEGIGPRASSQRVEMKGQQVQPEAPFRSAANWLAGRPDSGH